MQHPTLHNLPPAVSSAQIQEVCLQYIKKRFDQKKQETKDFVAREFDYKYNQNEAMFRNMEATYMAEHANFKKSSLEMVDHIFVKYSNTMISELATLIKFYVQSGIHIQTENNGNHRPVLIDADFSGTGAPMAAQQQQQQPRYPVAPAPHVPQVPSSIAVSLAHSSNHSQPQQMPSNPSTAQAAKPTTVESELRARLSQPIAARPTDQSVGNGPVVSTCSANGDASAQQADANLIPLPPHIRLYKCIHPNCSVEYKHKAFIIYHIRREHLGFTEEVAQSELYPDDPCLDYVKEELIPLDTEPQPVAEQAQPTTTAPQQKPKRKYTKRANTNLQQQGVSAAKTAEIATSRDDSNQHSSAHNNAVQQSAVPTVRDNPRPIAHCPIPCMRHQPLPNMYVNNHHHAMSQHMAYMAQNGAHRFAPPPPPPSMHHLLRSAVPAGMNPVASMNQMVHSIRNVRPTIVEHAQFSPPSGDDRLSRSSSEEGLPQNPPVRPPPPCYYPAQSYMQNHLQNHNSQHSRTALSQANPVFVPEMITQINNSNQGQMPPQKQSQPTSHGPYVVSTSSSTATSVTWSGPYIAPHPSQQASVIQGVPTQLAPVRNATGPATSQLSMPTMQTIMQTMALNNQQSNEQLQLLMSQQMPNQLPIITPPATNSSTSTSRIPSNSSSLTSSQSPVITIQPSTPTTVTSPVSLQVNGKSTLRTSDPIIEPISPAIPSDECTTSPSQIDPHQIAPPMLIVSTESAYDAQGLQPNVRIPNSTTSCFVQPTLNRAVSSNLNQPPETGSNLAPNSAPSNLENRVEMQTNSFYSNSLTGPNNSFEREVVKSKEVSNCGDVENGNRIDSPPKTPTLQIKEDVGEEEGELANKRLKPNGDLDRGNGEMANHFEQQESQHRNSFNHQKPCSESPLSTTIERNNLCNSRETFARSDSSDVYQQDEHGVEVDGPEIFEPETALVVETSDDSDSNDEAPYTDYAEVTERASTSYKASSRQQQQHPPPYVPVIASSQKASHSVRERIRAEVVDDQQLIRSMQKKKRRTNRKSSNSEANQFPPTSLAPMNRPHIMNNYQYVEAQRQSGLANSSAPSTLQNRGGRNIPETCYSKSNGTSGGHFRTTVLKCLIAGCEKAFVSREQLDEHRRSEHRYEHFQRQS